MSLMALVLALAFASMAAAQSTQPSGAVAASEGRPIRRVVEAGATAATPAPASTGGELARMLAALGIVLALIGLIWWVGKRYFNPQGNVAKSRSVRVLSRQPIAPRQQVLLLQVGAGRVIVVADSAGTLTTLANIDDADEVAHLIGTANPASSVVATSDERDLEDATPQEFERALGAQQSRFTADRFGDEKEEEPSKHESAARSEVSSLLDKVKSLRAQMQR